MKGRPKNSHVVACASLPPTHEHFSLSSFAAVRRTDWNICTGLGTGGEERTVNLNSTFVRSPSSHVRLRMCMYVAPHNTIYHPFCAGNTMTPSHIADESFLNVEKAAELIYFRMNAEGCFFFGGGEELCPHAANGSD